eukprot:Tamp_05476.p1 GENE.Tamp_05476~~Tamp_05476.p1  ORF type:complete len:545 (+),score=69.55 Tamp_05476:171-1637(+)
MCLQLLELRHARAKTRASPRLGLATPAQSSAPAQDDPPSPPLALLVLIVALQSACFGCIGTALPPALRASGLEPAAVAILLGKLGSASAFFEVLLSSSFGKLADAIGRKPILVMAPALTVLARLLVVASPTLPVLIGVRFLTTLVVPIYWLAFQATMADCYARDATKLAVIGSRVQAGLGLGYAVSVLLGGWLAATDIRYAYAASCALGCCVLSCHVFFLPETLPAHRRVPFRWQGSSPLAFLRLFRRGALSFKLNTVVVLQSLTNGMGDLWQVLARELRGWGAAECGTFASFAGLGSMAGTLLTAPGIKILGARWYTVTSTGASAITSLVLGKASSNVIAYAALAPMTLGAGKGHALSARIVNLGSELGVPQGQLSAERNTLNAIIKVIAPSMYAALFAFGSAHGLLGLPFYATGVLLMASALMASSIPSALWQASSPSPPSSSSSSSPSSPEAKVPSPAAAPAVTPGAPADAPPPPAAPPPADSAR